MIVALWTHYLHIILSFLKFGKMFPPCDFGGLTTQVKVMVTSQNMIMALLLKIGLIKGQGDNDLTKHSIGSISPVLF